MTLLSELGYRVVHLHSNRAQLHQRFYCTRRSSGPAGQRIADMPLNASSSIYLHLLANISLIALSLFFTPLCTFIALSSRVISPYTPTARAIKRERQIRASHTSPTTRSRVVLVTSVGQSKGLSIARAFYSQGHTVIGADCEPFQVPVCGRFSRSLQHFYKLPNPASSPEAYKAYLEEVLRIVKKESVELWVNCAGVGSALEEAETAVVVEKRTNCKVIQFDPKTTMTLHEKHTFIRQALRFGLNVPETHYITSVSDALLQLEAGQGLSTQKTWIMKSIGADDTTRMNFITFPRPTLEETRKHLIRLKLSPARPFVLQEFIKGPEYCTHSVVIRGRVVAFAACLSAEMNMHYKILPPSSQLAQAMQKYTEMYAEKLGDTSGHFSIDFMLDEQHPEKAPMERLYPIECNPRAHTAVVLFNGDSPGMVDAYLSALEDYDSESAKHQTIVFPTTSIGYYWIGSDLVTRVLLPLLSFLTLQIDLPSLMDKLKDFAVHVVYWKDGTYEAWDPMPFWWLYCVYWPTMFLLSIITTSWWSACNVSTTKLFRINPIRKELTRETMSETQG